MSKITKPQTPPALLSILIDLLNAGQPSTAADLNTNSIYMGRLLKADLVQVKDTVKSGGRGRPAYIYTFTSKGRSRAKRAAAKVTA